MISTHSGSSQTCATLTRFRTLALVVTYGCVLGIGTTLSETAEAQRATFRTIASDEVSTSSSKLVLDASKSRGAFRNIRLRNTGARIRISNLRIVYSDGTSDEIRRNFSLRSGERTRVLNSGNKLRFVDKAIVEIRPESRRRAGQARLELFGTQTRREARLTRRGGAHPDNDADHNVLFGYRTVDFDVDRDEIKVGRNVGRFSHLRLKVFDSDVYVRDLRVDYADGSIQSVPFNTTIKAGKTSEWFEVHDGRFIKKIVLIYRSRDRGQDSARIEVAGQYAKNWLDPAGEGRKYNDGWVLLGAETAGSIGYDTDRLAVGRNKGGFQQLRVNVRDRSITLRELRVVYDDGREDVFRLTRRVDPGQTVGPFKLAHENKAIREIVAKYRSRLFFGKGKGTAVVEVWARH